MVEGATIFQEKRFLSRSVCLCFKFHLLENTVNSENNFQQQVNIEGMRLLLTNTICLE